MKKYLFFILALGAGILNLEAQRNEITGRIMDSLEHRPLANVVVRIDGTSLSDKTNAEGRFGLKTILKGKFKLLVEAPGYGLKRVLIFLDGAPKELGDLNLLSNGMDERRLNLISLTEDDFEGLNENFGQSSILQATRDVFLTRAAFDFSQAFFKVRAYDSNKGLVLFNALPVNKIATGRPQWNNWGGLNDVLRNQQFSMGLSRSDFSFGNLLGTTNIDTRPSRQQTGFRLTSSVSNRSYTGRIMATYNSGLLKSQLTYALSASRRWAREGYITGTLYDAYSIYGSLEYKLNTKNGLNLTAFLAHNRRGSSAPISEEVFQLTQRGYNPYWGEQNGAQRNSRERKIAEPFFLLNYFHESENLKITSGVAFQIGKHTRSRLGYFNAPNPDPTYYRYLPSYYTNSSIGANFLNAQSARDAFVDNPQINWAKLYQANTSPSNTGKAVYLLMDDVVEDNQLTLGSTMNLKMSKHLKIDLGGTFRVLNSSNYGQISDMLGAVFHEDIDPFSNTSNDADNKGEKKLGSTVGYNYLLSAEVLDAFLQLSWKQKKWNLFLAAGFSLNRYERNGRFRNGRFPDNSKGPSQSISFSAPAFKSGLKYRLSGRQTIAVNGMLQWRPPTLNQVFINPRENNTAIAGIRNENLSSIDFSYYLRWPGFKARITAFYTSFQDTTERNFFFVDSGVGSDFVQEVVTGLDRLHMGVEIGASYKLSSEIKLTLATAQGRYIFANNPEVSINFDPADADEEAISPEGFKDLGKAKLRGVKLSQGPQTAFSLGLEYRSPRYWWIAGTANYLTNTYLDVSVIRRTDSFKLNPDTGETFDGITAENLNKILKQKKLDPIYLLNLTAGKSWRVKGKYISFFLSINNLFDRIFRTGGFEQSRNGNYGQYIQDNLSGTPSFGPKYWFGYGRTFFLNLAVNL